MKEMEQCCYGQFNSSFSSELTRFVMGQCLLNPLARRVHRSAPDSLYHNDHWPLARLKPLTGSFLSALRKALFRTSKSLTTSSYRVEHHLLSKNIQINHWPGWIQQQLVVFWPAASSRSSSTWTALRPFSNSHLTDGLRHCSTYMCPFYQSANQRPVVSWNHNEIHAAPLLVHDPFKVLRPGVN